MISSGPESCTLSSSFSVLGRKVQHDPNPHQHGGSLHFSGSGEFYCHREPSVGTFLKAVPVVLVTCTQGTVLCDIILLNFLKGAEQYKAKKFEEVKVLVLL